jgi:hypothetical protein
MMICKHQTPHISTKPKNLGPFGMQEF